MKVQILGFVIFGLLIASVFSQDPDGTEKSTTISAVLSGVDNASTIEVGFESTSRTFRYTPKATTTSEPDGDSSADPKDITNATT